MFKISHGHVKKVMKKYLIDYKLSEEQEKQLNVFFGL